MNVNENSNNDKTGKFLNTLFFNCVRQSGLIFYFGLFGKGDLYDKNNLILNKDTVPSD